LAQVPVQRARPRWAPEKRRGEQPERELLVR